MVTRQKRSASRVGRSLTDKGRNNRLALDDLFKMASDF
jgi:hypothetical protein